LNAEAYAEGVHFFRRRQGRIGIDLPRVLRDPEFIDNLILQDGDSIWVPRFNAVVNVQGAVNSPVSVAYVPGQDVSFYIRAAGGPRKDADIGRVYVTQPNGKVESMTRRAGLPDGVPKPRAGSTVLVPVKDAADRKDYTAMAAAVAQILASLVAIVVVVSR
jgi:protein involved in polysaccharide export with SLBB domain